MERAGPCEDARILSMHPTREQLLAYIRGQNQAAREIERERKDRLRAMSDAEALAAFEDLCRLLETPIPHSEHEALDRLHVEFLVRRRRALDTVSMTRRP